MTFIKFKYVCRDRDRHGNVRFYFRRPGKPKVRLRGMPGSEEFLAAYKEALAESGSTETKRERSFEWLCERYFQSPYFEFLEKGTQRRKRSILNEVCNITSTGGKRLGTAPYRDMKKIHVRKLRDMKAATPIGANNRVKEISALFAWAVKNDLATLNPAEKLEKLRSVTNGLYTWTEQDVERFEDYWPVGSRPRLAMAIMLYLGVRRSDAVLIGIKQESRDGETVTFRVFKGHKRGATVLTLPVLPPLRAILDASALGLTPG